MLNLLYKSSFSVEKPTQDFLATLMQIMREALCLGHTLVSHVSGTQTGLCGFIHLVLPIG